MTANSRAPRRQGAPARHASWLRAEQGNGRAGDETTCPSLIYGTTSSTGTLSERRSSRGDCRRWPGLATFIPEPYGAHGYWVLNARNALDSGRTYERGGRQHAAIKSRWPRAASWTPALPPRPHQASCDRTVGRAPVAIPRTYRGPSAAPIPWRRAVPARPRAGRAQSGK